MQCLSSSADLIWSGSVFLKGKAGWYYSVHCAENWKVQFVSLNMFFSELLKYKKSHFESNKQIFANYWVVVNFLLLCGTWKLS